MTDLSLKHRMRSRGCTGRSILLRSWSWASCPTTARRCHPTSSRSGRKSGPTCTSRSWGTQFCPGWKPNTPKSTTIERKTESRPPTPPRCRGSARRPCPRSGPRTSGPPPVCTSILWITFGGAASRGRPTRPLTQMWTLSSLPSRRCGESYLEDVVAKVCLSFRQSIEAVIKVGGGHIE